MKKNLRRFPERELWRLKESRRDVFSASAEYVDDEPLATKDPSMKIINGLKLIPILIQINERKLENPVLKVLF
jgi:hypothetical protein